MKELNVPNYFSVMVRVYFPNQVKFVCGQKLSIYAKVNPHKGGAVWIAK